VGEIKLFFNGIIKARRFRFRWIDRRHVTVAWSRAAAAIAASAFTPHSVKANAALVNVHLRVKVMERYRLTELAAIPNEKLSD
jgi:hypothetical protein